MCVLFFTASFSAILPDVHFYPSKRRERRVSRFCRVLEKSLGMQLKFGLKLQPRDNVTHFARPTNV